jgi:DNA-binding NarL/FixJ family response regulator
VIEVQKIIIADRNRLMREMVTKAINADDKLMIVRNLDSYDSLFEHVQQGDVDWVIVSLPDREETLPLAIREILINFPSVGVLIVSPDGRHVRVKRLEEHERILDGISLDELILILQADVDSAGREDI